MDAYESLRAQVEAHIETHGVEEARLRAEIDALRARAEAAEARAAQAEAEVGAWRDLLLSRVRGRCGDPDLHTDRPGAERPPVRRLWRVVSHRGVVSVGATEGQALLRALDAREQRDLDDAISQARADERHFERAAVYTYLRAQAEAGGDPWMVHIADEIWVGSHRPSHAYPEPVAAPV